MLQSQRTLTRIRPCRCLCLIALGSTTSNHQGHHQGQDHALWCLVLLFAFVGSIWHGPDALGQMRSPRQASRCAARALARPSCHPHPHPCPSSPEAASAGAAPCLLHLSLTPSPSRGWPRPHGLPPIAVVIPNRRVTYILPSQFNSRCTCKQLSSLLLGLVSNQLPPWHTPAPYVCGCSCSASTDGDRA